MKILTTRRGLLAGRLRLRAAPRARAEVPHDPARQLQAALAVGRRAAHEHQREHDDAGRRRPGAGAGRARGARRRAREGRRREQLGRAGHGIPAARAIRVPAAQRQWARADPAHRDPAEPRPQLHRKRRAREGAGRNRAVPRDAERHRLAGDAAPRVGAELLMQIRPEHLAAHLTKGLRPIYTVWGDEPLLAQEAGDAIRAAARASGCTERQVHTVAGAHFDWSGLLGAALAMSLFAQRQLIEIRIPSGKPGKDGSEALQRYCEALSSDVVTLVQLPRLDRSQQGSAWFSALDAAGVTVRVDPIARAALPQWIAQRLARQGQRVPGGDEGQRALAFFAD